RRRPSRARRTPRGGSQRRGAERRDRERDRAPDTLDAPDHPVRRHRDAEAVHDRVTRRDREVPQTHPRDEDVNARPDQKRTDRERHPQFEEEYHADGQPATNERRQYRAQDQATTEQSGEPADGERRQPLPLTDHDDRQHESGPDEVPEAEEEGARAHERVSPQEPEPLAEPVTPR